MTDTERVEEAARSFLDDQPDAEEPLRELVAIDSNGPWEFEDTRLDSGRFGELVSREFVESVDGGYRFVDRTIVQAAIDDEPTESPDDETTGIDGSVSLPSVDATAAIGLLVALAGVAVARMSAYRSVFQHGYVVSPANDPYYYRYWQEQMFQQAENATAAEMLANVPGDGRPMTHYPNWILADVLGGTPEAAEPVVAWLPVVSAVLTALCVYAIAVLVTDDRRIGLAAVAFLALTPVHAVYTGLGFIEHRPHQYVWLAVLVFALCWLAVDVRRRYDATDGPTAADEHVRDPRAWAVAALLAGGVFGSVFSWAGSPITFVPVAIYLAARTLSDVRADIPPLRASGPTVAGIAVGTILVVFMHVQFGWDRSLAVAAPVLVVLGSIGVVTLAAVWHSLDRSPAELLVSEGLFAALLAIVFWLLRPGDVGRLWQRAGDLFGRETATETASLLSAEHFIIFTPVTQLGLSFYLALAALVVVSGFVYRRYEPGWLLLVSFAWYYLALATVQVRFAAQLSLFLSVFAAVALLYGLAKMELARQPAVFTNESLPGPSLQFPESVTLTGYLVGIVAFVLLVNLIFLPSFFSQSAHGSDEFGATMTVMNHAERTDHSGERVLSRWGTYRMHNYFLTGNSHNYGYALQHHEEFITDTDADAWYDQFAGTAGYVVLEERDTPDSTVHTQLFDEFGAGRNAVGHYQLLYSADGVRAFTIVPGATVETTAPESEPVTVRTEVSRAGESFTYERRTVAGGNGTAAVVVAYPGTYDVGGESVRVTESDVLSGTTVTTGGESSE